MDGDDKATDSSASSTPRMKAPPKTSPPPGAAGDEKDGGAGAKKKKALPPPSNPPPQGGSASAAAAFRAKSSGLPPPNGPPPTGAVSSASVAKIRGAARPPSAGPPPGGAALAKPVGAPPTTKPPPKVMGAPPSTAPPSRAEAKPGSVTPSDAPDGVKAADAKRVSVPPPSAAVSATMAKEKPEAKRAPPATGPPPMASEAKTPRPLTAVSSSGDGGGGGAAAKAAAPVDILSDASPIVSSATGAAAPMGELGVPPSVKASRQAPPRNPPPSSTAAAAAVVPLQQRPQTTMSAPLDPRLTASFKPPVVKKSTMDVLNDTTASLSLHSRNIDEHLAKTSTLAAIGSGGSSDNLPGAAALAPGAKIGRAAPFSGSSRPNVPEEEVITVKKLEAKKPSEPESESKPTPAGGVGSDSSGSMDAKTAKPTGAVARHFDDSLDDVEEIPFLEDAKPEPKLVSKPDAKRVEAHEDDPIIEVENKHAAPKAGGGGHRSASAHGDAKDLGNNSNHMDDKARGEGGDDDDDDALLSTQREGSREDIYDELRKLKRASPRVDESASDADSGALDHHHAYHHARRESADDDAKDTGSRERTRERRKEKRRGKADDEPKKIQAQFFNPKSVPYVPDHLLDFVKRPLECGRGHIMKCFIERNDSGPNKLSPIYTLLLEVNSSSGRPVMYARKKAASRITSHYVISMNKDDLFLSRVMRSHQYIGKLRSSTNMLEYCLYDQGDNPEDLDSDCEVDDELRKSIRAELAVIRFHNSKKPYARKMEVVIPQVVENGSAYLDWRPISRDQMMEEHVRAITAAGGQNVLDTSNFVFLHKRETKYDPLSSCIVDFRSRATCVSVKNFQLVHSEPANELMRDKYRKLHPEYVYEDQGTVSLPQEHVLLQLGKVGKDCFNMDFQYPLSMLQAFAICLSRFDTKQR